MLRQKKHGFLCFFKTRGTPKISVLDEESTSLLDPPTLAIEISEHAYFLDYAFERDRYLSASLERLKYDILFH
jgi:superoxide dismutase